MVEMMPLSDEHWMEVCLEEARAAAEDGEVPVGAVVVHRDAIVARGRNASIRLNDPSAHAEIIAMRAAGAALGNYRLPEVEVFVSVEPCLMCVGALLHARVRRVVYGCADPRAGALGSIADFSNDPRLNHRLIVKAGVCSAAAGQLLQDFLRARR